MDAAFLIEAQLVIDAEIMALAGRRHVLVAIGANFNGSVQPLGGNGAEGGKLVALRFLAAEAAAHAAHLHRDGVGRHLKDVADDVLDFAGMLGGAPQRYLVILTGHGHGNVAFEIKMLLPADPHRAGEAAGRHIHFQLGIAARQRHRIDDERAAIFNRRVDIGEMRQVLIGDLRLAGGLSGDIAGLGEDCENRLAVELHLCFGQQRFVVTAAGGDVVFAGHILANHHPEHTRCGFYL
ncbi:hypothetical protein D3C72_1399050 [compost metagenome]